MYEFLRGAVANLDAGGHVAFDVGGIGYRLVVSEQTRQELPLDGTVLTMYVRLQVREDDLTLYGFGDVAERAAFDLLTGVQGVGPAAAMAVLSTLPVAELRRVLAGRETAALTRVKGIGRKTAERLVLELKDKADRIPVPAVAERAADPAGEEARQALIALGFAPAKVAAVLDRLPPADRTAEETVREALALLR